MAKKFESDGFMRTTEGREMRQTRIPGRRDERQWVAGRGVSTFRMCDGQTDKCKTCICTRVAKVHTMRFSCLCLEYLAALPISHFLPSLFDLSFLFFSRQVGRGDEKQNGEGDTGSSHHVILYIVWSARAAHDG